MIPLWLEILNHFQRAVDLSSKITTHRQDTVFIAFVHTFFSLTGIPCKRRLIALASIHEKTFFYQTFVHNRARGYIGLGMVESIGIDIIELERIAETFSRFGRRFTDRILSDSERDKMRKRPDVTAYLAGRFAAKEAVMKALGAFFDSGVHLRDIEILNDKQGRPCVCLPEHLQTTLQGKTILLSISHSRNSAVAMAIVTSKTTD